MIDWSVPNSGRSTDASMGLLTAIVSPSGRRMHVRVVFLSWSTPNGDSEQGSEIVRLNPSRDDFEARSYHNLFYSMCTCRFSNPRIFEVQNRECAV